MKKIGITLVLIIALVFSLNVISFATNQAIINTTEYSTLQDALDASNEGDTIKLNSNVTLSSPLKINKAITLDGNGKTIYSTNKVNTAITINSNNSVTFENVTLIQNQYQTSYKTAGNSGGGFGIYVIGGNLKLNNCTVGGYREAIRFESNNKTLTISRSNIYGFYCINMNCSNSNLIVNNNSNIVATMETKSLETTKISGSAICYSYNGKENKQNKLYVIDSKVSSYGITAALNTDQDAPLICLEQKALSSIVLTNASFDDSHGKSRKVFAYFNKYNISTYEELQTYVESVLFSQSSYSLSKDLKLFSVAARYSIDGVDYYTETLQEAADIVSKLNQRVIVYLMDNNSENVVISEGDLILNTNNSRFDGTVTYVGDSNYALKTTEYGNKKGDDYDPDYEDLIEFTKEDALVLLTQADKTQKGFLDLDEAFFEAKDGATIKLLDDVTPDDVVVFSGHIYFDMNNKTMNMNNTFRVLKKATLEFTNKGSIEGEGIITGAGIYILKDTYISSDMEITGGKFDEDIENYLDPEFYGMSQKDGYYIPDALGIDVEDYSVINVPKDGKVSIDPITTRSSIAVNMTIKNFKATVTYADTVAFGINKNNTDFRIDLSQFNMEVKSVTFVASVLNNLQKSLREGDTVSFIKYDGEKVVYSYNDIMKLPYNHEATFTF